MRVGAGISTDGDPLIGASEAARTAAHALHGEPADLVVVFAAGAHLAAPEATLQGVHAELAPEALIGCGAGGVLGEGRELESGTAVAVWAASLGDGSARPFHATVTEVPGGGLLEGLPEPGADSGLIMLSDPYSFPTDAVLAGLARDTPGIPVLGGLSSGRSLSGSGALFLDETVHEQGAVGVCLDGVEMLPCVSQGAAPLGREMTITAADANVILELAGKPAVQTIEEVIAELSIAERALVAAGLLIGIVIDGGKPDYEQGDFLVRGVLGVDSDTGAVAVGANVSPGQVVRLHARDAGSADEDLRRALGLRARASGAQPPAGALVFSCNGRGQSMFGACDHDATMIDEVLGGTPAAGFFAAGEIGPVGGRSFLHTFTATVAVFPQ
ncbi:MAG TPA: FIST N-terminal domain-containing protein [Solirubrobacteraceae bacterium]|nr:FIST N-terminal domain-containing protein [Solirubrobacteraceae bacterium]